MSIYPLNLGLILSTCVCVLFFIGLISQAQKSQRLHGNINRHVALVLLASLLAMPLVRSMPEFDSVLIFLIGLGLVVVPLVLSILSAVTLTGQMLVDKSPSYVLALSAAVAAFLIHVAQIPTM